MISTLIEFPLTTSIGVAKKLTNKFFACNRPNNQEKNLNDRSFERVFMYLRLDCGHPDQNVY